MRNDIARPADRRLLGFICAMCCLLGGAILAINHTAADYLIRRGAEADAQHWAGHFAANLPGLEAIAAGQRPSADSFQFIAQAREVGQVFSFNLFDQDGLLRLSSDDLQKAGRLSATLDGHNERAALAIASGQSFTAIKESQGKLFAETYVPVLRGGRTVGTVEVHVDRTEASALYRQVFHTASLLAVALAVLGFAVPALALHRRTRQKRVADDRLHFLAHHDVLTKLPNRAAFIERVDAELTAAGKTGELSALHFIDADLFKEINDHFGHDAGDELLTAVAARLKAILRGSDIVSRFGGDEFLIAQFGFETEAQIQATVRRMTAVLRQPYRLDNREVHVTFSIGTAVAPADGAGAETLIKRADMALYAVKAGGRNGQQRFDAALDEQLRSRIELETIVREAAHHRTFALHFQPLFTVGSVELTGFEALLRLDGPGGTPISPATFIPVAEDTGLIDEIGDWVLRRACRTAAQWPDGLQLSVNLSAVQFHRKSVCDSVRAALADSGLAPQRLILEITESLLLTDNESILAQLSELKAMGIAIAMDDFGSGYSSLGYMLRFPFDRIKIDRSFVNALASGEGNAKTLVQTIISLGHTLNMKVTAEGVETLSQADQLRGMACDDAQGFLFGRPVPETEIAAVILRQFANRTLPAGEMDRRQSA